MTKNVVVLMGGWSAEREVSLVSGAACVNALKSVGYAVTAIDVQRDMSALLTRLLPRPDVVFNALHGRYGEDGCVQGLLDPASAVTERVPLSSLRGSPDRAI